MALPVVVWLRYWRCLLPSSSVQERAVVSLRQSRGSCTTGSYVFHRGSRLSGLKWDSSACFAYCQCVPCVPCLPSHDLPSPTGKRGWMKERGGGGGLYGNGGRVTGPSPPSSPNPGNDLRAPPHHRMSVCECGAWSLTLFSKPLTPPRTFLATSAQELLRNLLPNVSCPYQDVFKVLQVNH